MGHWGLGIGEEEDKEEAGEQRGRGEYINNQYFSTRGYANGKATSTLRQSSGQRVAQYKSVQVPHAPCLMPNLHSLFAHNPQKYLLRFNPDKH